MKTPYGYCPRCKAPGVERERRPFGDDKCQNGHTYPSVDSVASGVFSPGDACRVIGQVILADDEFVYFAVGEHLRFKLRAELVERA